LDSSFGGTGDVNLALRNPAVEVQPDDRIVVVGYDPATGGSDVDRLNADGSLDASFGTGGIAVVIPPPAPSIPGQARNVVLETDGKIVVGGREDSPTSGSAIMVARLNADGSVDTTFGVNGIAVATPGSGRGEAVALEPDGRIVEAGMDSVLLACFLASG